MDNQGIDRENVIELVDVVPNEEYEKQEQERKRKNGGFSLAELLVAGAIVGVLAAISVPAYHDYRARGYDAAAQQDLHSVVTALEAYYQANETYPANCNTRAACEARLADNGINGVSRNTDIRITRIGTTDFWVRTWSEHSTAGCLNGTGTVFNYRASIGYYETVSLQAMCGQSGGISC